MSPELLSNNYVEVHIGGFNPTGDRTFSLKCHRGYGAQKFWDELFIDNEVNLGRWGVDHDDDAIDDFWDAVSYNTADPTDGNDYGNLTEEDAKTKWTDVVGLIDVMTHGNKGLLGWYWRTRFSDPINDPDMFELFDPAHDADIEAKEINPAEDPLDLNDVLLAVLNSCDSAGANDAGQSLPQALKDRGVDVVLSWKNVTYREHSKFMKYFFEYASQKVQAKITGEDWTGDPDAEVEWDNYPTVNKAILAAYFKLAGEIGRGDGEDPEPRDASNANYVCGNLEVGGKNANPGNVKLFPARYGAKD